MKKKTLTYYLLTVILFFSVGLRTGWGQVGLTEVKARRLVEQTLVVTDRETYCVKEEILFSAHNISSNLLQRSDWSNVLYLELVAPDGTVILQNKYAYNGGAKGVLTIPRWVLTGNYYLRAYTRWMRDFSSDQHFCKMIRIINPFRSDLLAPTVSQTEQEEQVVSSLTQSMAWKLKINKQNFIKRELVKLEFQSPAKGDEELEIVVSVIRKGTEKPLIPKLGQAGAFSFSPYFIPETRGVSVSGKVVQEVDSLPMPYTLVGLTIFKDNPENLNLLTDENGRFYFDLSKLKGAHEIFISAKVAREDQQAVILVDNDFLSKQNRLPFVTMDFSDRRRDLYETLSFTSQMQTLYREKSKADTKQAFSSDSTFYGNPDFTLDFDEYIALPSVEEYLHELVPRVRVMSERKAKRLQVVGTDPELNIYDPLVMVDMVSVFDVKTVLALDPEELRQLEVISRPYVRGDITYGGIVSFFSRKGDLAGIDLPSAGRFIAYRMLSDEQGATNQELPAKRIPDLRNCLYWNPAVELDDSDAAKLVFSTGDNTGEYLVVVRAVNQQGEVKVATTEIHIE
ncbi:hypothetical protein [Sunxiuqinia sp. sy24]|uniref:hypothetical protein n=1 Tax=Sunxiuqinia sp. sy24 TaxID=3461495 RepID=UPI004045FF7C